MSGVEIRVLDVARRERAYRMRMPFRFGVTTATHGRQAIVRAHIAVEGREAVGYSAEALGAKWFDKNLSLSDEQNHHQLRRSLELASEAYLAAGPATPFALFADHYEDHVRACADVGLNPLIASYGQSLVDRAVLDALCRGLAVSFREAMRRNLAGLRDHPLSPEFGVLEGASLFGDVRPSASIAVRHTVGLADPILTADIPVDHRIGDGLPESLEEVVATYGNRYFKIKLGGDEAADLDRLGRIASVIDGNGAPYRVTLDGNEQYEDAAAIAAFWRKAAEVPGLGRLIASTLYVEQPISRRQALAQPVAELASLVPVIIDESDGALEAFAEARALGYAGVSSKACKGIYKSMLNHCRCRLWNADGDARFFMSAEDLTCEPGTALQQDLALVDLLGLTHVERNAHHFIDGFDGRPRSEAEAFLVAHPDLYHRQGGRVRLLIDSGRIGIGSLDCAGFGAAPVPDLDATEPMPPAQWPPRGLGIPAEG